MGKAPLTRRQFLHLIAAGVAAEALLPFCDPELQAEIATGLPVELQDNEVHLKKRASRQNKSYGSGNFGEWTYDTNDLPCFHYTCNQTEDPLAAIPVETAWRVPTDHTHQIGNDRILAAASNYGYIQVRQDEGGPKFLNDYHPESGLFGAGIGYLTDGDEILSTYYPGAGVTFERFFGMGYLRKQTAGKNFSVDQTIYAPFGDDPVIISEVVISSQNPKPANLYWVEYWGCQPYPFSHTAITGSYNTKGEIDPEKVVSLRRESAQRFSHRFEKTADGLTLLQFTQPAVAPPPAVAGGALQEETAAGLPNPSSPAAQATTQAPDESEAQSGAQSEPPPTTFLATLDEGPVRFLTNAAHFFGATNVLRHTGAAGPESVPVPAEPIRPAGLAQLIPVNVGMENQPPDDLTADGPESALILVKPFTLDATQSQTMRFIYGYLPNGFSASELTAKYRAQAPTLFATSSSAWKDEGIQFAVDQDAWVEREASWHNYYLRSGFTYDDFFAEHIVSQGQVYQYCFGFQGAARDPLQHALPLVFGESRLAKEVLRYTLKSQGPDGALPFGITGHGSVMPIPRLPSDLDLWLLWLASEYILATRDAAFLEEGLPTWPLKPGGPALTVREMLNRCYRHLIDSVGIGQHGLLRGDNVDWNDNIYRQGVLQSLADEVRRDSESVMNAAMAAYILDHYARMLRYAGHPDAAKEASDRAAQQRNAVRAQWAGEWFKRLWLGPRGGWLGDGVNPYGRLWLDGQPWAIVGDCATPDQRKTLIQSIDQLLRKPSKIGAKQVSKKVDWPGFVPGESENGGGWAALGGTLIWALAATDPAMAYDEWKKNSRANHAEVYPGIWYGAWSGPDVFCSSDSDHAGQTAYDWGLVDEEARHGPSFFRGLSWTAWPVMNMHRHAWPLYSAAKLLGIEFNEAGVDLAPTLPAPTYSFRSKLVGLLKSEKGYEGWYAPMKAGSWTVRLRFAADEAQFQSLTINGSAQPVPIQRNGTILLNGTSAPGQPLRWSLLKDHRPAQNPPPS
jgi:hypothetical protein